MKKELVYPVKGRFVSEWSDGSQVSSNATLYEDGCIVADCVDVEVDGFLEDEKFILEDGTELEVCLECHNLAGSCEDCDCDDEDDDCEGGCTDCKCK